MTAVLFLRFQHKSAPTGKAHSPAPLQKTERSFTKATQAIILPLFFWHWLSGMNDSNSSNAQPAMFTGLWLKHFFVIIFKQLRNPCWDVQKMHTNSCLENVSGFCSLQRSTSCDKQDLKMLGSLRVT